jgi:hypothetical protein
VSEESKSEVPPSWTRQTVWTQGSIVRFEDALRANLFSGKDPHEKVAMVISHDCDLAVDDLQTEPHVEVVVGHKIEKCKPECSNARSTRILHLELNSSDGPIAYEFLSKDKGTLLKKILTGASPESRYVLSERSKRALQSWLAARYKRAALPDGLSLLLDQVKDVFVTVGKKNPEAILGIYLDYEPEGDILAGGELYEVWITVLYSTEIQNAKEVAEDAIARISNKFQQQFKSSGNWRGLELRSCVASSETELTYYDLVRLKEYRLEYLTLRVDEPNP